jgi:hypothetical protein
MTHKANKNVASVLALSHGGVLPEVRSQVRSAQKVRNEKPAHRRMTALGQSRPRVGSMCARTRVTGSHMDVSVACARELMSQDLMIYESRRQQHQDLRRLQRAQVRV